MQIHQRWQEQDGKLQAQLKCRDFNAAVKVINDVAELAEAHNHHPDLCLHAYNRLTITLISHDSGGVTERDYELAAAIDQLLGSDDA